MTSPPYWALRDYGVKGQLGLEPDFREYISNLVEVFNELKRVLKSSGSFYLNLGDTYSGSKIGKTDRKVSDSLKEAQAGIIKHKPSQIPSKCLLGIPWRVALVLMDNHWILRNDICWFKPNAMPSSVHDRLSNKYDHIFHFVKSKRYYYNLDAIRDPHKFKPNPFNLRVHEAQKEEACHERNHVRASENNIGSPLGKNPGDLWTIPTRGFKGAHFAVYPQEVCIRPILSSCPEQICAKCGTPRTPVIHAFKTTSDGQPAPGTPSAGSRFRMATDLGPAAGRRRFPVRYEIAREIVGYTDCGCNAGFRLGIVLDMFAGSGTTLVQAKRLGRSFIGIELNPAYVGLARRRLSSISP